MPERLPSENRKDEILAKALALLFESGTYGLTMRNLAQKVGLSEAALYRHFLHKEDLVQHLATQTCDPLLVEGLKGGRPWDVLEQLMQRQFQRLSEKPQLTAFIFQEGLFPEYPQIKQQLLLQQQEKEKLITAALKQGQTEGIFDPNIEGEIFALIYMGSMRMAVLKWKESGFSYSLLEQGERIMEALRNFLKGD